MQHLRRLIESRPFLTQVPDRSLLATRETSPLEHLAALRGEGYGLVYTPTGKPFRVRLDKLSGREAQAWWFDPRTGDSHPVQSEELAGPKSGETASCVTPRSARPREDGCHVCPSSLLRQMP